MFGPGRRVARRTARRTSRRVNRRQEMMRGSQEEPQAPQPQAQATATPQEGDYAAELQKLAQLKEQGILSEAEFEAKKKQILGI